MNNQKKAFQKLSKLKCGALFMEMGTGKTKVALDLINSKIHKVDIVLWICPISIKQEIIKEKEKWYPDLEINVVGCESIGSSDKIYLETLNLIKNKNVFTVVDESLKIKNSEAKRTKRILEIGKLSKYRLILNGTPLSKNVMDLWTQMEFLSHKILNMTELEFKNTFCEYYLHGRKKGLVKKTYNTEYLISLIQPYIFDSKLDLEINTKYEYYYYDNLYWEEYNQIKDEIFDNYINEGKFDFFILSTKLQKCYTKSYMTELSNLINKINDKVIVFIKYLSNIPKNANKITGEETLKERTKILKDFENNKFQVLYMTYGVGAFGLNLQFCNHIIFADQTFDYSQKIQAEHRIYRMGQNKDVHYYNLFCNCGIEKIIIKSLNKKTNLLTEIKKEIAKKGEKEWLRNI
jgi:SNF2 family DNA or RNA helicase